MANDMYGPMRGPADVTKINVKIRAQVRKAKTRDMLKKLVSRSRYLYTLTSSPSVQKAIRGKVRATRTRAKSQYTITARLANRVMVSRKIKGNKFDTIINLQ